MTLNSVTTLPPENCAVVTVIEKSAIKARVVAQLSAILSSGFPNADTNELAEAAIAALAPRDLIEADLSAQIAAAGYCGMDCLQRACLKDQKPGYRDMELTQGERFIKLHGRLLESFERRRQVMDLRDGVGKPALLCLNYRY